MVRAKARDSALADKQVRDRARMDPVARNLLFINLITDCFPALALGLEKGEPDTYYAYR